MADVNDLVAQIEERRARLDRVDQAIADIRRLLHHRAETCATAASATFAEPRKKARTRRA